MELDRLQRLSNVRDLDSSETKALFAHIAEQREVINSWYEMLQLISRSGSAWSGRVRELLDNYNYGTTDKDVINAVKILLAKHKTSSVALVLERLERLDKPLNRSGSR